MPIEQEGRVAGALEVGRAADDVSDTLRSLLLILGVAYPVTLAVASFGGIFLAGRALSPIDKPDTTGAPHIGGGPEPAAEPAAPG